MTNGLEKLPLEVENIILDYKYQLEYSEKMSASIQKIEQIEHSYINNDISGVSMADKTTLQLENRTIIYCCNIRFNGVNGYIWHIWDTNEKLTIINLNKGYNYLWPL